MRSAARPWERFTVPGTLTAEKQVFTKKTQEGVKGQEKGMKIILDKEQAQYVQRPGCNKDRGT